ncbi:hypothetical protein J1N35_011370 [Gossypium stocksii]|uniref:Uncharacterized protein n=1 Tax=Gossypium stocksii TaxID=47602 RepID=A0A9D3W2M6_9ROSI|nr:hypothetical protein J1N35_011370 [Gossypium stocksii]
MANVMIGFEHATTTPKFKRHKVSAVRYFSPGYGRGVTTDFGLNRQFAVDQDKYSLSFGNDYEYLVLQVVRCVLLPYDSIV